MAELSILEKRVVVSEKYGREWADLHAIWLQLDESKKSVLAGLQNDLDDGDTSGKYSMTFDLADGVTVEEREVVHNGKIIKSVCLVARIGMTADDYSCGFVGNLIVVVGDINVARKLQDVLEAKLRD